MTADHIFISHATADDDFVRELRQALQAQRLTVWVDPRHLRGGYELASEVKQAIATARQVILVLNPNTVNFLWVRREILQALRVEKQRRDEGYRVIPLLLPGVQPAALPLWFNQVPMAPPIQLGPGGLSQALPAILAALGERLPTDDQTANLHGPTPELHHKQPDDRERSRFASVELALRQMPADVREQVQALAVFHDGAQLGALASMLGLDPDGAGRLASALIDVGLGEDMGYGHLRLDPTLHAYLLAELGDAERQALRMRWGKAMISLTFFLYEQRSKDTQLAAQLTLLELPNLLAMLAWAQENLSAEETAVVAGGVETLVANLDRPEALAQATRVRERAAQRLGEWSFARFGSESANIDRLLERGDLPAAHAAARQLLERCLAGGGGAYDGAAYDIAEAHMRLGRVLEHMGASEAALAPLAEAQGRFQRLADAGNASAARMASVAIAQRADCLTDLGRLDEAAAGYEEAIKRKEGLGDTRGVAVSKAQLGTVRRLQQRYAEALAIYAQARDVFSSLAEPRNVAAAWHQMGIVHREAGQYEQAERAYRQALGMWGQMQARAHEVATLGELGTLYSVTGRLEEAVTFHRQAVDIHVELQDLNHEGLARTNLADTLTKQGRYDEARRELERAIVCKEPFGHAAEPWKTWAALHSLEQAAGNPQAAAQAHQKAVQAYLAYRRAGGVGQTPGAELSALVTQAIRHGKTGEAEKLLAQLLAAAETTVELKPTIPKLQAILRGSRDPALATDPNLDHREAAELQLLLESLGS